MAQYEFPWRAFLQAKKEQENKTTDAESIGKILETLGQTTGGILQQRNQKNAQVQFAEALGNMNQPAQGPTAPNVQGPPSPQGFSQIPQGQSPAQPPVNFGQLTQLFQKAYPGQQNPFVEGMTRKMFPSPESQFQAQKMDVENRRLALDQRKADIEEKTEKAKLLEQAGYHAESAQLRKETIDNMKAYREELANMRSMMFNANQNQKADTKNMGVGGFFRGLFGGGVSPSKVPVPGSDDRSNVRRQLGLN